MPDLPYPSHPETQIFDHLVECLPDILYRFQLHPEGRLDFITPMVKQFTGYSPEDFYQDPKLLRKVFPPEDQRQLMRTCQDIPCSIPKIVRFRKKNGETIWMEHRQISIYDQFGNRIAIEGIARDVTEHSKVLSDLKKTRELVNHLVELSKTIHHTCDLTQIGEVIGRGVMGLTGAERCQVIQVIDPPNHSLVWDSAPNGNPPTVNPLNDLFTKVFSNEPVDSIQVISLSPNSEFWEIIPEKVRTDFSAYRALLTCPLFLEGELLATLVCFHSQENYWDALDRKPLESFCRSAVIAIDNSRLFHDLETSYLQSILALARAMDARDTPTAEHCRRLMTWVEKVAKIIGCDDAQIQLLRWAALFHDIGKIGIPDKILHKPGRFTPDEWVVMRQHPEIGARIISPIKKLTGAAPSILSHHEKYDGTGYPQGLKGKDIPLGGRILSVADAYLAMTDWRVYRKPLTTSDAILEINHCAGTQFDPEIVKAFTLIAKN